MLTQSYYSDERSAQYDRDVLDQLHRRAAEPLLPDCAERAQRAHRPVQRDAARRRSTASTWRLRTISANGTYSDRHC